MSSYYSVFGFPLLKIFSHIFLESSFLTANFGRMGRVSFNTHESFALWASESVIPVGYKTNPGAIREGAIYSPMVSDYYAL